ncbi:MAG: S1 family peptidase [Deltaproteobacteria bacterium]|nr:S1 family peptidase [Deltaproteobacteria bacterium]
MSFRFALATFSLLGLSLSAACGSEYDAALQAPVDAEQAIINGEACSEDVQPTAVAILIDAEIALGTLGTFPIKSAICTGTLIAPDTVLAAAHCIDEEVLLQQFFGLGTIERISFSITRQADLSYLAEAAGQEDPPAFPDDAIEVVRWVKHDGFDINDLANVTTNPGPGDYNDVALLFMASTIDDVEPEIVITAAESDQVVQDAVVEIAGWGQQTVTSGGSEPPPAGTVGIKICGESFINVVGDTEFQVGGDSSTTRKCHGDSGGPTFMTIDTDHERKRRVIGITSHAFDETDCETGGVDTRVSSFLEWIDTEMRASCGDDTRVWCEVDGLIEPGFYDPPAPAPAPAPDAGPDGEGGDDDKLDDGCNATHTPKQNVPFALFLLSGLVFFGRRQRG